MYRVPYKKESTMNLNEFDKKPGETPRKKRPKVLQVLFTLAVIVIVAVVAVNVWPHENKDKNDSFSHQNDIIFYNPSDNGSATPPMPTTPPAPLAPESGLICSKYIDACATQEYIDAEIARMTDELADRGLPIGSPDVTVRDAQMSHIITDVCYQPTEGTFLAGESLWNDVWVNTPQTNRSMRFVSALSAVCGDQLDTLRGYLAPKNPYEDPSYNGNVPNQPPSEYTPPMPPTMNEGTANTPTPPELAPSANDRDYN